jgi:hypothetical protein
VAALVARSYLLIALVTSDWAGVAGPAGTSPCSPAFASARPADMFPLALHWRLRILRTLALSAAKCGSPQEEAPALPLASRSAQRAADHPLIPAASPLYRFMSLQR